MFLILNHLKLLSCMFLVRIVCLCIVQSHFVPDEYWQSLEVAHRTVFGYGYETWEWKEAIRSYFYPFWFAILYKLMELLRFDYVELLILFPRVVQSVLSSITDVYFWLWLKKMSSKSNSVKEHLYWTYLMWVMCLFVNYCSSRTLTNTLELDFSTIALYYYPWKHEKKVETCHFLWFVGFACLARPTAAIQWLPLCICDVLSNPDPVNYCSSTYRKILFKIVFFCMGIDFLYYKKLVLTPMNFLLYNGQYNVGIHYGFHSWFWYILVGIPIVLGPAVILFYLACYKIFKSLVLNCCKKFIELDIICSDTLSYTDYLLFATIMWTVFCYSIVPHKEFRFILPLVPIMLYVTGCNVNFKFMKQNSYKSHLLLLVSGCTIVFNIIGIVYLGLWHQVGPLTVISKLADVAKNSPNTAHFLFLTPCHATPLYSHLHVNVTTRFLTCEPNLRHENNYKDESDLFFDYPLRWLEENYGEKHICLMPSHIILYSNLEPKIEVFLNRYNYTKSHVIFNSQFTQGRQSQYFEIFEIKKFKDCFTDTSS